MGGTLILPGTGRGGRREAVVEGAYREGRPRKEAPLRQASGLPPPRTGEDQSSGAAVTVCCLPSCCSRHTMNSPLAMITGAPSQVPMVGNTPKISQP